MTISIELPAELEAELRERAKALGVAPEELVKAAVTDLLVSEDEVESALEHVLSKNAELYRRLA